MASGRVEFSSSGLEYLQKIYISFQCAIAVAMCAFIASMELEVRENVNIISVEWF